MPRNLPKIPGAKDYYVGFSDGTTTLYRNWTSREELEKFIISTEKAHPVTISHIAKKQRKPHLLKRIFSIL